MNAVSPVETLVTDHLDLWTAALKRKSTAGRGSSSKVELYGIKKLRELILELAVRGLLVPQDPNDEPASELLKRIAAEKAKLVKEGKIKKDKSLPPIATKEMPFDLPKNWCWARLGEITNYGFGDKAESADVDDNTWVLELEDVEKETSKLLRKVRFFEREFKSSKNVFNAGDVIYGKLRPYLDKVLVADEDGVCTTEMIPFRAHAVVTPAFLRLSMKSPRFIAYANSATHGMNLPRVGTDKARLALIPICSESIQHRIVAKVDELMALCDQLEQQTNASLGAHQTLVETLLSALTSAADHAQFASAWQRIAGHFDTLFTTEESIAQLKQTILQLAVMGKLVPQDPNDEPASELLKKIAARPHKHTLPGWATISLGQLGDILGGATPSKSNAEYWTGNIPWVSPKDMKRNLITDAEDHVSEAAISNSSLKKIPPGSLLMVVRGMILAHSFPVAISECEVTINQDMKALVIPPEIGAYLLTFMQAMKGAFVALVDRSSHGTCKLVSEKLWSYPVSLPPRAEQHRIVAKVDKLMALCDQLKSRLSDAQTTQLHLADALVEQAIG